MSISFCRFATLSLIIIRCLFCGFSGHALLCMDVEKISVALQVSEKRPLAAKCAGAAPLLLPVAFHVTTALAIHCRLGRTVFGASITDHYASTHHLIARSLALLTVALRGGRTADKPDGALSGGAD